eukprot:2582415-Amphidinium_carterae.1
MILFAGVTFGRIPGRCSLQWHQMLEHTKKEQYNAHVALMSLNCILLCGCNMIRAKTTPETCNQSR